MNLGPATTVLANKQFLKIRVLRTDIAAMHDSSLYTACKCCCVTESEIETMTCKPMYDVCGITNERRRPPMYASACRKYSKKDGMVSGWMLPTSSGSASGIDGGCRWMAQEGETLP